MALSCLLRLQTAFSDMYSAFSISMLLKCRLIISALSAEADTYTLPLLTVLVSAIGSGQMSSPIKLGAWLHYAAAA